jgi:CheY-like chemotaxis protein
MVSAPGLRLLVVEDEVMISALLEDMLSELGHHIVALAASVEEAGPLAAQSEIDGALLDVNLPDGTIEPIAAALAQRNKPFVFTTGYADRGIPPEFKDRPVLRKPYQIKELGDVLARIRRRSEARQAAVYKRPAPQSRARGRRGPATGLPRECLGAARFSTRGKLTRKSGFLNWERGTSHERE